MCVCIINASKKWVSGSTTADDAVYILATIRRLRHRVHTGWPIRTWRKKKIATRYKYHYDNVHRTRTKDRSGRVRANNAKGVFVVFPPCVRFSGDDTRNAIVVLKKYQNECHSGKYTLSYIHYAIVLTHGTVASREFIETTFDNGGQYNGATNRTLIDIHVEPRRLHGNNNDRDDGYSYLYLPTTSAVYSTIARWGPFRLYNDDTTKRIAYSSTIPFRKSDCAESTRTVGFGVSKRTNSNRVRSSEKSDSPSLDTCFVTENNRLVLRKVAEYRVVSTPSLCVWGRAREDMC